MNFDFSPVVSITVMGAQSGGGHLGHWSPEIFKTLHSNFTICRNFQKIKIKLHILIIFKKRLAWIFICPTGSLSPSKIYLETGHLIENFVNDWYLATNMLELSKLGRQFEMHMKAW